MTKINWGSVKALLKYDFINYRRSFLMMILTIESIIIAVALIVMSQNNFLIGKSFSSAMSIMTLLTMSSFSISWICIAVWVFKIMHQKFSRKMSSTSYFMLPANAVDKVTVLHIEYVLSSFAAAGLFIINTIILTAFLCFWTKSDNSDIPFFQRMIEPFSSGSIRLGDFSYLLILLCLQATSYIIFLNLNMLFRKHEIAKSFITQISLIVLYGIYIFNLFTNFINDDLANNLSMFDQSQTSTLGYLFFLILAVPMVMLFYAFTNQIKEREVK